MEQSPVEEYPGQRLGLPAEGRGSVAAFGRRVGALVLDWGLALLVSRVMLHGNEWTTLGVFALLQAVCVTAFNGGPGHLALGMRVTSVDGRSPGPLRAVGRAVLLSVAIPALVWDRDQRGLHDRLMGTVLRRV
ncbi:RDD family protein [Angustibacter sp. McL0619]|uniref:RDD family protein n=1 Tax=Angustibacter sp. McL0619 TaxID=3415676 RepID=UPI003CE90577